MAYETALPFPIVFFSNILRVPEETMNLISRDPEVAIANGVLILLHYSATIHFGSNINRFIEQPFSEL